MSIRLQSFEHDGKYINYCADAQSTINLQIYKGVVHIEATSVIEMTWPIRIEIGPLEMILTEDQAIAFGDALICAVHKRRSAIAQAMQEAQ